MVRICSPAGDLPLRQKIHIVLEVSEDVDVLLAETFSRLFHCGL